MKKIRTGCLLLVIMIGGASVFPCLAGEARPAAERYGALLADLAGPDFAKRRTAEKGLLAAGMDALPALIKAEAGAPPVFFVRVKRLRRMIGYRLPSDLAADMNPLFAEMERRIKGRDWNAVLGALDHAEGEVSDLARKIVRKVSTFYLGRLAQAPDSEMAQVREYFLEAPLQNAELLKVSADAGHDPLAKRARKLILLVAEAALGKLSDKSGAVREKSEKILFKVGPYALRLLEKAAAGKDPDTSFRAKRLLVMIEFRVSPDLYDRIGHILSGYDKADWLGRRRMVVQIERLCQADARDVLMAIIEREKSQAVKDTAGAALLRTVVMGRKDFSIIKFLSEHGVIKTESIPAITLEIYQSQGNRYSARKEWRKAIGEFERALEIDPKNVIILYNTACCWSQLKEIDKAIKNLRDSVKHGYKDWRHMEKDKDFDNIRADERYKSILSGLKAKDKTYDPLEELKKREDERKDKNRKPRTPGPPKGPGKPE